MSLPEENEMDPHREAAQVAAILASRGVPARVVNQGNTYGVEMRMLNTEGIAGAVRSAVWTLKDTGWCYVVTDETPDGDVTIAMSGFSEVGIHDAPEHVAYVMANFPYDGEMSEDDARQAVKALLQDITSLTDQERADILEQVIPSEVEDRETLSWQALQETGLLWAINRQVFNPMGLSLSLRYAEGEAVGWVLLGEGDLPVQMDRLADIDGSRRFGAFMESLSQVVDT